MQALRHLKEYFLIGSNVILNIATQLAILDHVASYFNFDEGTGQHQENTRGVIVALYAALVLGMEWRSARRMTEEVMAAPDGGLAEEDGGWHNGAIGFDCWYKTIGKGIATAMVISKLGGGATAGTLAGLVLGAGGYLHARNPGLRPNDIIHQVSRPGQLACDRRGLMNALLWAGVVASAIDNSGRYTTTYKIAAHEIVDAFHDSDTESYLDDDALFLAAAFLSSTATMYSKFLLARNRSVGIWNMHAAARNWQDWFDAIDKWAVLGAGAHAVLAYCNDRFLTQRPIWNDDRMPDWLSLTASVLFPALGFLGTYATNADYSRWEIEDGVLVRRGPPGAPEGYRKLPAKENKQDSPNVQPPDHPADQPNAHLPSPDITAPLLPARSSSSSTVTDAEAKGGWRVQERFAVGEPNASLPQQPVGATTPLLPRPLSPPAQKPPVPTEAKTGRGGWFSFWRKGEQSASRPSGANANPPSSTQQTQTGFFSQAGQFLRFLVSREQPDSPNSGASPRQIRK